MRDFQIDFQLHRHAEGYRLVPDRSLRAGPPGEMIVPMGPALISCPPLEKFDTLYSVFAEVKTPDALVSFVKKFGLLSGRGSDVGPWGDSITRMLREAQFFRDLLSCKKISQRRVASCFGAQLRERLAADYAKVGVKLPPKGDLLKWQYMVGHTVDLSDLHHLVANIDLVPDPVKGIELRITTDTLIGALWWQLARKLMGEAKIRECRQCRQWFEAGLGTGRRADAEFCCDEHKTKYFSLRRSKSRRT
jgi:hypothetical protein